MTEVLDIPIARTRVGWGARVALDPAAAPREPEPGEEVPRIARTLALAHEMQRMIDEGEVKDQAELARMLGFTRARLTQILDLTLLAPDIQHAILVGCRVPLLGWPGERNLRGLTRWPWSRQRWAWSRWIGPEQGCEANRHLGGGRTCRAPSIASSGTRGGRGPKLLDSSGVTRRDTT